MEEIELDIGLCTHGSALMKNFPNEDMVPLLSGYLYIKHSNAELFSKSQDFNEIVISGIPISVFQEAAQNLGRNSDFQKRLEKHAPVCERRTLGLVSPKFRELFEKITDISSLLGMRQNAVSNYHIASLILYHLGNDIPTYVERQIWHALCGFINVERCTFCLDMQSFLDDDTPPAIHKMAHVIGMSLTTFKNKCTEYLNMTPHKWLIKQQLQRAYVLTLTSNRSIGEIGPLCKFDNNSHFIKLFKREFGVTPLSLRQSAEVFDTKN